MSILLILHLKGQIFSYCDAGIWYFPSYLPTISCICHDWPCKNGLRRNWFLIRLDKCPLILTNVRLYVKYSSYSAYLKATQQTKNWSYSAKEKPCRKLATQDHEWEGWIENLSRGSPSGIMRLAKWWQPLIRRGRFLYPSLPPSHE